MTTQEKHILLNRYKRDALFRQWLPTLGVLSRAGQGGEVEIWYEAERALLRLRQETHWREVEVQLIYTDLCERYPALPVFCLAVMAVLFTCLADAAPSADRAEENRWTTTSVSTPCSTLSSAVRATTGVNGWCFLSETIWLKQAAKNLWSRRRKHRRSTVTGR